MDGPNIAARQQLNQEALTLKAQLLAWKDQTLKELSDSTVKAVQKNLENNIESGQNQMKLIKMWKHRIQDLDRMIVWLNNIERQVNGPKDQEQINQAIIQGQQVIQTIRGQITPPLQDYKDRMQGVYYQDPKPCPYCTQAQPTGTQLDQLHYKSMIEGRTSEFQRVYGIQYQAENDAVQKELDQLTVDYQKLNGLPPFDPRTRPEPVRQGGYDRIPTFNTGNQ
ncbi:MAG: hypothetical protein EZS28_026619 [Streblomastix strix]|uniref:Uncharacterized protein n=1 Tax=Streblomastix strix TaxID=222440 RepID=A0A5J4V5P2_9EUKA|nr:MAG: hypothetical protein EZS28_026619 [Streblomastix strix]